MYADACNGASTHRMTQHVVLMLHSCVANLATQPSACCLFSICPVSCMCAGLHPTTGSVPSSTHAFMLACAGSHKGGADIVAATAAVGGLVALTGSLLSYAVARSRGSKREHKLKGKASAGCIHHDPVAVLDVFSAAAGQQHLHAAVVPCAGTLCMAGQHLAWPGRSKHAGLERTHITHAVPMLSVLQRACAGKMLLSGP